MHGEQWEVFEQQGVRYPTLPAKVRHLLGLAVAETQGCERCSYYHEELARLHGAVNEELDGTRQYVRDCLRWHWQLENQSLPMDAFRAQVEDACESIRHECALSFQGP